MIFDNCTFSNNFAIYGGVGVIIDDARISLKNSIIQNNSAFDASLL